MNPINNVQPQKVALPTKRYSSLSITAKSILATGVLAGVIGSFVYFTSTTSTWSLHQSRDFVEEAQKAERQNAFTALGAIVIPSIPEADIFAAANGMGLSQASRDALLASLKEHDLSPAPNASASPDMPNQDKVVPSNVASGSAKIKTEASADPIVAKKTSSVRLAWITLWDTDAEDGDVVRIDSQGYYRTITLTKQPVTIAIPVPKEGTINITGVRDGEGGGITVGLASGESRAVFPIMSVGQTLGLRVKVR